MTYENLLRDGEKSKFAEELLKEIETIPDLEKISIKELRDRLYTKIEALPTPVDLDKYLESEDGKKESVYNKKLREQKEVINRISSKMTPASSSQQISDKLYTSMRDDERKNAQYSTMLKNDMTSVVNEFIKDVQDAYKLYEEHKKLRTAKSDKIENISSIDVLVDNIEDTLLKMDEYERASAEDEYIEQIAYRYAKKKFDLYMEKIRKKDQEEIEDKTLKTDEKGEPDTKKVAKEESKEKEEKKNKLKEYSLIELIKNEKIRERLTDALEHASYKESRERAKSEFNKAMKGKTDKYEEENKKYKEALTEIDKIIDLASDEKEKDNNVLYDEKATKEQLEKIAEELVEYSGGGTFDEIKTSEMYSTRLNELIANGVKNKKTKSKHDFKDEYDEIKAKVKDITTKREAIKQLAELKDIITFKKAETTHELKEKIEKVSKTYKEYKDKVESLDKYFKEEKKDDESDSILEMTNLSETFRQLAIDWGYSKMNNEETALLEDGEDYKEIKKELVKKEAHDKNYDYQSYYSKIKGAVTEGKLKKSKALKALKKIDNNMAVIEKDVKKQLDEGLTHIYRNVLANSEHDKTALDDGGEEEDKEEGKKEEKYRYSRVKDDTLQDNEWENNLEGSYVENGLLRYYEDFIGEGKEVEVEPGAGAKIKNAAENGLTHLSNAGTYLTNLFRDEKKEYKETKKLGKVKKRIRKPNVDRHTTEANVVARHINAAYHELNDDNRIEIDDVVKIALGRAVDENDETKIDEAVKRIEDLNANSTIDDIYNAYMKAANLGEKVNKDAKRLTTIEKGQFKEMDNYVNKKAGWSFYMKDTAVDKTNGLLEWLGVETSIDLGEKNEFDIHKTAIRPNRYPAPIVGLAGLAALLGGYVYLHDKVSDEKLTKENSTVLSTWEILKEAVIALGAAKYVAGETHKPKSEKQKGAAKTETKSK